VQLGQNKEVAPLLIKQMFQHPSISFLFHLVPIKVYSLKQTFERHCVHLCEALESQF
jgi:hypothetical protein